VSESTPNGRQAQSPDQLRESSMRARVEKEMRIATVDEDQEPRIEELEIGGATYTKMLSRRFG
jgi:hypothetical protein